MHIDDTMVIYGLKRTWVGSFLESVFRLLKNRYTLLLQWLLRVWWWCFCSNNFVYNLKSTWLTQKNKKKDNNNSNTFLWKKYTLYFKYKKAKQKRYECKRDINYKRKVTFLLLTKSCIIKATLKAYKSLKHIFYVF